MLGHNVRPVRPVCAMASGPAASGILHKGCGTILPRGNQSTHTCLMEVENAVSGVILEYPINARLGSDLVTEKAMTYG